VKIITYFQSTGTWSEPDHYRNGRQFNNVQSCAASCCCGAQISTLDDMLYKQHLFMKQIIYCLSFVQIAQLMNAQHCSIVSLNHSKLSG